MKESKPVNRAVDFTNGKALHEGTRKAVLDEKTDSEIFRECQQFEDRMFNEEVKKAQTKALEF